MQFLSTLHPKVWKPLAVQLLALLGTFLAAGDFGPVQRAQLGSAAITAIVGYFVKSA
jgi:hypothetical protein